MLAKAERRLLSAVYEKPALSAVYARGGREEAERRQGEATEKPAQRQREAGPRRVREREKERERETVWYTREGESERVS